jgi:hypothetical protein
MVTADAVSTDVHPPTIAASSAAKTSWVAPILDAVRPHAFPCAVLFALGLAFRLREVHAPLYGDQALYFYLSESLGIATSSVKDLSPLWTHVAVRPFMYVFFWPWANMGMTAFRVANIVVGATVPCLIYCLSVRFRVGPALAAIVALAASVHPVLVTFSVKGFPDNLATALALGGYLAYFSNRRGAATALLLLTVLTKEAYAMFLLPLLGDGAYRFMKTRSLLALAPFVGLCAVVVTNGISIYLLDGRLQGWGSGKPESWFFRAFLASSWFIPLYVLLLLEREMQVLLVSLAAPAFYAVWALLLHRGIEQWYIYGPFCVALVGLSVGLQSAMRHVASPIASGVPLLPSRRERMRTASSKACAIALLATIVILPEQAGWRNWLDLVKLEHLLDWTSKAPPDHAEEMARVVKTQKPRDLLIVDTFWAYAYYPFGATARHVANTYTSDNDDGVARAQFATLIAQHDYVLIGDAKKKSIQADSFQDAFQRCQIQSRGKFALYSVEPACLAKLPR